MKCGEKLLRTAMDTDFALSSLIYKQKSCEVCSKKHNQASMILCDRCEDAFHIKCLKLNSIPKGTWVCRLCVLDINHIKQSQIMNKRPILRVEVDQCAGCRQSLGEYFQYQERDVRVEAKFVNLVTCVSCKASYHSLCFSCRPQAINCTSCQETIRQNVPKGHTHYLRYLRTCRERISALNYLQLTDGFSSERHSSQIQCGSLAPLSLVPPQQPKDWRVITAYQASLCYALATRGMIYCENLITQMKPGRIETILKGHKSSVEKIYRLCKVDQQVYELFKRQVEQGHVPPLEIKEDRKKGFYMIASDIIAPNTIIAEYTGELITARESLNMVNNQSIFTLIRNPRSADSLDIAPSRFANIAIFISGINNNDQTSQELENVRALKFMYRNMARLILVTERQIRAKQTLYLNYNGDRAVSEYPTNSFVQ